MKNKKGEEKKFRTNHFYKHPETSQLSVPGKIFNNVYPVILLQSVEHVLSGTLRTLSDAVEGRGKRRLVASEKRARLKRQKVFDIRMKGENIDDLSDAMLLDSYVKYL